jgi:hypothetical protein
MGAADSRPHLPPETVPKIFTGEFVFMVAKPLEISYNTMMKYFALRG